MLMPKSKCIETLEKEKACVLRVRDNNRTRQCADCDLVRDDSEIISAYDSAIFYLQSIDVLEQQINLLEQQIAEMDNLLTKLHKARKGKKRWKNRCLRVTSDYAKLAEENKSLKEEYERLKVLIIKEQHKQS